MKIFIISFLLSLQAHLLFSQCISVELSVIWEAGYDIFKKDSVVNIPKLHFTYRNLSSTSYYLLKICDNRDGLPWINCGIIGNYEFSLRWSDAYIRNTELHNRYENQKYNVIIDRTLLCDWEICVDSIDFNKEHGFNFINCDFGYIYDYIFFNNLSKNNYKKFQFSQSDFTEESILVASKDQFVFLKPGEIYVDTFNLAGFKLVKGLYTFVIKQPFFMDSVLVESIWDDTLSEWKEERIFLPDKVGEYQLYSGPFYTNSVTVTFSK